MSDVTDPGSVQRLAAISFSDELKAVEFMTAMTRLARDRKLTLHDAVFIVKNADGKTFVRETSDLQPSSTAIGAGLWSGLFGLLLGGPVGMLVAGGIGAGAGAVTAKVVDVGMTDDFVAQLREMVQPGTTTVALLAEHVDTDAVLAELQRFEGARYVAGNLPLAGIQAVRDALGDPAATSGGASLRPPRQTARRRSHIWAGSIPGRESSRKPGQMPPRSPIARSDLTSAGVPARTPTDDWRGEPAASPDAAGSDLVAGDPPGATDDTNVVSWNHHDATTRQGCHRGNPVTWRRPPGPVSRCCAGRWRSR